MRRLDHEVVGLVKVASHTNLPGEGRGTRRSCRLCAGGGAARRPREEQGEQHHRQREGDEPQGANPDELRPGKLREQERREEAVGRQCEPRGALDTRAAENGRRKQRREAHQRVAEKIDRGHELASAAARKCRVACAVAAQIVRDHHAELRDVDDADGDGVHDGERQRGKAPGALVRGRAGVHGDNREDEGRRQRQRRREDEDAVPRVGEDAGNLQQLRDGIGHAGSERSESGPEAKSVGHRDLF